MFYMKVNKYFIYLFDCIYEKKISKDIVYFETVKENALTIIVAFILYFMNF